MTKTRALYSLLVLTVAFRTLVVPGLTPVVDADSPLGFNIAFCENIFEISPGDTDESHHDGHSHSHSHDNTGENDTGIIPLSNHCSVGFIGGIFIETYGFNIHHYLEKIKDQYTADYTAPFIAPSHYRIQASRAPPVFHII